MKTNFLKASFLKNNRVLVLFIYAIAFVLMTWSFSSQAASSHAASSNSVIISTSMGDIEVKLNAEKAPISTQNFLKYVDKKHYDNTIFHRVIKDFMIQGGGFTADMKEKDTLPSIHNEAKNGLSNKRGTIAMARTGEIHSATAQFFINTVDNARLDHRSETDYGYAVFGEVTKGLDVVDKIRAVKTITKGMFDDVPAQTVTIKSIRRSK